MVSSLFAVIFVINSINHRNTLVVHRVDKKNNIINYVYTHIHIYSYDSCTEHIWSIQKQIVLNAVILHGRCEGVDLPVFELVLVWHTVHRAWFPSVALLSSLKLDDSVHLLVIALLNAAVDGSICRVVFHGYSDPKTKRNCFLNKDFL